MSESGTVGAVKAILTIAVRFLLHLPLNAQTPTGVHRRMLGVCFKFGKSYGLGNCWETILPKQNTGIVQLKTN